MKYTEYLHSTSGTSISFLKKVRAFWLTHRLFSEPLNLAFTPEIMTRQQRGLSAGEGAHHTQGLTRTVLVKD